MNLLSCRMHVVMIVLLWCGSSVVAEELTHRVVLEGLNNPTGVAVQPDTGTVFVVESGARRIVRLSESGDKAEPVVIGFPADEYGKGPSYTIGPLGIAFIDKNTIVIGGGGRPDGEDRIYVVTVPEPGAEPVSIDDAESFAPLAASSAADSVVPGEGNFFNVVVLAGLVYATANGDDQKGWIARGRLDALKPTGPLERFLATKEKVKVNAPVALTMTPRNELLVGQMGAIDSELDSLVTFYSASDGKLLLNLETNLYDIISLQYGPENSTYKKSHLYALDYAWSSPEKGRLVRLDAILDDAGKQKIKSVTLASLVHPTSMAFGNNGELYVTLLSGTENVDQTGGKLIRFEPGL